MENIIIYMQEQERIRDEFDALCDSYGLPKGKYGYVSLLTIFANRRNGGFPTQGEFLADFSAMEIARMLKQLSFSNAGFSLVVGVVTKDYNSPTLVEVLKQSLVDALAERVVKVNSNGENYMILYKSSGRKKRGFYLSYPAGCSPQEVGFSENELDAIIDFERGLQDKVKKMQGNVRSNTTPTKNPELGELVLSLMQYLPEEWSQATKNAFLADYLCSAGFLDFKGKSWLEGFREKEKSEKDRLVRNWIKSYKA